MSSAIVLSDIVLASTCSRELFVFTGAPENPEWLLWGPTGKGLSVHGAGLPMKKGAFLTVGVVSVPGADEGVDADWRCGITWAGVQQAKP
jgi:hypothetical protein